MSDWVDEEYQRRERGHVRGLLQSQHATVNARYPGCTLEYCFKCGAATGRAGQYDDSIYDDDGEGPYCEECWDEMESRVAQEEHEFQIARQREWDSLTDAQRSVRIKNAIP